MTAPHLDPEAVERAADKDSMSLQLVHLNLMIAQYGDDFAVVPRKPTRAMYAAWMCDHRGWSARYKALIDAASPIADKGADRG